MNVLLNFKENKLNKNNVYFSNAIKNTVLDENSLFVKILYSDENIILNGVYFYLDIQLNDVNVYNNKKIYMYNLEKNKTIINNIIDVERFILNKYDPNIKHTYSLKELFSKGFLKVYSDKVNNKSIYVKISGIWKKDDNEIGLTYKIHDV